MQQRLAVQSNFDAIVPVRIVGGILQQWSQEQVPKTPPFFWVIWVAEYPSELLSSAKQAMGFALNRRSGCG